MQAKGFALAHAGADEKFAQVGDERVGVVAVVQELRGFLRSPYAPFGRWWSGEDGRACGVVGEAALSDGVAEGTGKGREAAMESHFPLALGELSMNEAGDVAVAELVELHAVWPGRTPLSWR
ncbi:hypothetical protein [Streptantibioticus ferralitis]|uniref:Uncharacterized protein n=1 Tax=Streptantibioticus ferralitis TaxID=236510 RepID=A0ABT5Z532_9ACTN|nr:hypothetical protein [Streptantibioticus ferralitis]MDF2258888.1 hypothetical protein [Streptantibioticus ferralitis]